MGFALELGLEPWNGAKPELEMDAAPSKQGHTVWTLLDGRHLGRLAIGWGGWPSIGCGLGLVVPPNCPQLT